MPDWVAADPNPETTAESWLEALTVTAEYAKDKSIAELLEGMKAPEPDELIDACATVVARVLTQKILEEPSKALHLPSPELLMQFITIGCLAGAVYAVSEMQEAKLRMEEGDNQPKEEPDGSEQAAE